MSSIASPISSIDFIHPITITHPDIRIPLSSVHAPPPPDNKAERYLPRYLALDIPPSLVPAPQARRQDKNWPTKSGLTSVSLSLHDGVEQNRKVEMIVLRQW